MQELHFKNYICTQPVPTSFEIAGELIINECSTKNETVKSI